MKKFLVFLIVGLLASSAAWGATIAITANAASKLEVSVDSDTWTIALDNTGAAYEDAGQGALTVKSSKSAYTVTSRHEQRYSCEGNETIPPRSKWTLRMVGHATKTQRVHQQTAAATKRRILVETPRRQAFVSVSRSKLF